MATIFISVDVETNGPIPGSHSMLSVGCAAFDKTGKLLSTFSANLEELEGSSADEDTAAWWLTQPEAWKACRENTYPPKEVMVRLNDWVLELGGRPVFVGYPAGFDHMFVYWYQVKFLGMNKPFTFSALDIKTYAMAVLDCDYRDVTKRAMKDYLPKDKPHTHIAVDDAIEQGELFFNLKRRMDEIHETLNATRT